MTVTRVPIGLYEEALSEVQAKEDKIFDAINDIESLIDFIEELVGGEEVDINEITDFCEMLKDRWGIDSIRF